MQDPNWKDLPAELLLKVASSADGAGSAMRGVCRDWRTGLEAVSTQLSIVGSWGVPVSLPLRFPAVTELDLRQAGFAVNSLDIKKLRGLPLTRLALEMPPISISAPFAQELLALALDRLDLELSGESPTKKQLQRLAGLPITHLDLARKRISSAGLATLRDLPLLNSLDLSEPAFGGLKDSGLAELRGLTLTSINLEDQRFITDAGLQYLRGMPLSRIDVSGCVDLSLKGLQIFLGLPITDLGLCAGGVDEACELIAGMPLTKLNAEECGFSDVGVEVLRGRPLIYLAIECGEMTDSGLEVLKGAPLTELYLCNIQNITDQGLGLVGAMPLSLLYIDGGQNINDTGMEALRGLPLRCFFLNSCPRVSNAGLGFLQGNCSIRHLEFENCPEIHEAGLEVFGSVESTGNCITVRNY